MKDWQRWVLQLASDLDIDAGQFDHQLVLTMARETSRAVDGPAVSLGAYFAGIAVGRGLSQEDVTRLVTERARSRPRIDWRD